MSFTEQLSQALSIPVASVMPSQQVAGSTTITNIDVSKFKRLMAHVQAGVLGTNANVQAYWQGSNTSGGTYANIAGGPTLTLATSNTEGTLEIREDQLSTGNRYVQLVLTVNANTSYTSAAVFGGEAGYKPANQYDYTNLAANRLVV